MVSLATFNVKDLFDAHDETGRARLDAKIGWLADAIRPLDADVLALQEIGSLEVLRALIARSGCGYGEPIVGTADARGIRCALVSRVRILASRVHAAAGIPFPRFVATDPDPFGNRIPLRRGVVQATLDIGPLGTLDVFVAHFKSNHAVPLRDEAGEVIAPVNDRARGEGHLRAHTFRSAEALFVRGLVDAIVTGQKDANVAVMGDFNDLATSLPVRILAGSSLVSCAEKIPSERRFSAIHDGARIQIDHILVTPALAARLETARFANESLREHPPIGAPYDGVDSDHAPLVARFA